MTWHLHRNYERDKTGICKNVADGLMKAFAVSQVDDWRRCQTTIDDSGNEEYWFDGLGGPPHVGKIRLVIRF